MSDDNSRPTSVNITRSSGGGLYFIVGALLILVLAGGYVILGMPGLNTQVARSPASAPAQQKIDVTVQQPAAPAAPGRR